MRNFRRASRAHPSSVENEKREGKSRRKKKKSILARERGDRRDRLGDTPKFITRCGAHAARAEESPICREIFITLTRVIVSPFFYLATFERASDYFAAVGSVKFLTFVNNISARLSREWENEKIPPYASSMSVIYIYIRFR